MNFSPSDFLDPNVILSDVLKTLGDDGYREHTRGWYMSQIQQCLEELGFDSFFSIRTTDVPFPSNMKIEYPKGCYNLREIYLINLDDNCAITSQKNVYWKRRFISNGSGKGYTAENVSGQYDDPFVASISSETDLCYFSVYNGVITLSDACSGYTHVRLVFNGVSSDIGETPFIPRPFRQVVKWWVLFWAYTNLAAKEPRKYSSQLSSARVMLYTPFDGQWDKAISRVRDIDDKMMRDMKEYNAKMNY